MLRLGLYWPLCNPVVLPNPLKVCTDAVTLGQLRVNFLMFSVSLLMNEPIKPRDWPRVIRIPRSHDRARISGCLCCMALNVYIILFTRYTLENRFSKSTCYKSF